MFVLHTLASSAAVIDPHTSVKTRAGGCVETVSKGGCWQQTRWTSTGVKTKRSLLSNVCREDHSATLHETCRAPHDCRLEPVPHARGSHSGRKE